MDTEMGDAVALERDATGKVPALLSPCQDDDELHRWVERHLGLRVPRQSFCPGHQAPFEYLRRAYFEPGADLVVWGPRGGGKTRLAAAATLLDLLHKPGVTVRILGGSMEQSLRMWEHLLPDLERLVPELLVKSRSRARRVQLEGGASAAALAQSQRAVRGQRVQKMRCDEVEMFREDVWEAAGATTRSLPLPEGNRLRVAAGVVEALSTHHETAGLFGSILDRARAAGTPIIRWCILDVMAPCTDARRECAGCELEEECGGRARQLRPDGTPWAQGFVPVEDVIRIKRRVSRETWEAEMLCLRPSKRGRVYPYFSPAEHVAEFGSEPETPREWELAVDFGYRNPLAALFIARGTDGRVYVVDEYIETERTLDEHVARLRERPWVFRRVACDPAGAARNEQTGKSAVQVLKDAGFSVFTRKSGIVEGIERVRRLIRPAFGRPTLVVHTRCVKLIKALSEYRYDEHSKSELPLKDGVHDHPLDALRYWLANEEGKKQRGSKDRY